MNSSLDARGPTGGIDLVFFLSFFFFLWLLFRSGRLALGCGGFEVEGDR